MRRHAHAPHVATRVVWLALLLARIARLDRNPRKHLGRRILGRAGDTRQLCGRVTAAQQCRVPKVDESQVRPLRLLAAHHHVLGLHIAVHNADLGERRERHEQLLHQVAHEAGLERTAFLQHHEQLAAWHADHGEIDGGGRGHDLEQPDNVRRIARALQRQHLRLEHLDAFLVLLDRAHVELLEREHLPSRLIHGRIDLGEAALAEQVLHGVKGRDVCRRRVAELLEGCR